jgi:D-alanyl-D-alanine carboxypeptidase
MMKIARNDYVELTYIYGGAISVLVFLSLIAMPIDTSRFGLIIPRSEQSSSAVYGADAFAGISVKAESYVVYDLVEKKTIAAKNAEVPLPLASITKMMTAVTALTHHDKSTKITIEERSIEGGYDLGLKRGQVWSLGELLKYTLVFSSNDGAHAIADGLSGRENFVAQMNTDSALLGLGLTFTDAAGLDEGADIGGRGSALDVAKLFGIARKLYPEILEATTRTRVTTTASNGKISGIPNTNQEITNLFGAEVSKTGFTDSAGGNLGVVVDVALGHPVVIVVLGSTREARFSDTERLYKALLESIK